MLPPSVQLNSSLFGEDIAYEGQQVNFTCITISTDHIITWTSDHYIDGILQVGFNNSIGFTVPSQHTPSTVATLINATTNGGVMMIESRLQITASRQNPIANVSCRINNNGSMNTTTFRTLTGCYIPLLLCC